MQSYTLCVKLHTEYKSSFTFTVKKLPSLEFVYTHAVTDVTDKYEVCISEEAFLFLPSSLFTSSADNIIHMHTLGVLIIECVGCIDFPCRPVFEVA